MPRRFVADLKIFPIAVVALLALGSVYLKILLDLPDDAVFYSGDGGIKYLLSKQYLGGTIGPVLELSAKHSETYTLWDEGLYPFGPPFVYRVENQRIVSFPMYFSLASAPFLGTMSWRGLYVLPAVSTILVWLWLAVRFHSAQAHTISVCAALISIVFASPATLYGAMFWEHAPATFLASLPLILFGPRQRDSDKECPSVVAPIVLGFLSGVGVFFRPEVLVCVSCAIGFSLLFFRDEKLRVTLCFLLGFVLSVAAFLVANQRIYGSPLGLHAAQVVNEGTLSLSSAKEYAFRTRQLFISLGKFCPPFFVVLLCLPFVLLSSFQRKREFTAYILVVLVAVPLTAAIVPNTGDKQWGPRYLLVLMPYCVVSFGVLVEASMQYGPYWRLPLWLLLTSSLVLGSIVNTWHGTRSLAEDYENRILPALQVIQNQPQQFVVVSHQWIAQELADLSDTKDFLWPQSERDVQLLRSTLRQSGTMTVLFVAYHDSVPPPSLGVLTRIGESRSYVIWLVTFEERSNKPGAGTPWRGLPVCVKNLILLAKSEAWIGV